MTRTTRIIACTFSLLLLSHFSNGQILWSLLLGDKLNSNSLTFGLHGDYSWNSIYGIDHEKAYRAFNLGMFFTYHFNEHWHIDAELMAVEKRGADHMELYSLEDDSLNAIFSGGYLNRHINYIGIQSTFQYLHRYGIFIEAGPMLFLRTKSYDIIIKDSGDDELTLKKNIDDEINRWMYGVQVGLGYRIFGARQVSIGMRYDVNLGSFTKNDNQSYSLNSWGLYCNFPVGVAKKKKKINEENQK